MVPGDFLSPVRDSLFADLRESHPGCLASSIAIHSEIEGIPEWNNAQLILIGVLEDRGAIENGAADAPDEIRKALYQLYPGNWDLKICDLGNIYKGETYRDTLIALQEITTQLLKQNCTLIIMGGSQDLTFGNYRGYAKLEQTVNMAAIDSHFDLGGKNEKLNQKNYLSHIILTQPYLLFNFCSMGYQSYYTIPEEVDLMERMYFDTVRLGNLRHHTEHAEPLLRDADIVTFDVSAVRRSDAPGQHNAGPNGLSGEEACALARYSGISDKVSSFGLYELVPYKDIDHCTARLAAQMCWYFIEGFSLRKGDYPFCLKEKYDKFIVLIEDGSHELVFYKSPYSGRWWIEVPMDESFESNHTRHQLIPCNYEDYTLATQNEIPERWWRAMKKSM